MQALPRVGCIEANKLVFVNYVKFSGRSRRSEFWYFKLTLSIIYFITSFMSAIYKEINKPNEAPDKFNNSTISNTTTNTSDTNPTDDKNEENGLFNVFFFIDLAIGLITLLPNLSVGVRRLHDTGRTGYYLFLYLIPIIGNIILIYFWICDSEEQANEYGLSPKYILPKDSFLENYYPPTNLYSEENSSNLKGNKKKKQKNSPIQMDDYSQ